MKNFKIILCMIISLNILAAKKWIFFDLGNTIINTQEIEFNYFPDAKDHLIKLKHEGYTLGLISNIPESFGETYEQKLKTLKDYISTKWDISNDSFDWSVFDEILLPLSNKELKPNRILFDRASVIAQNCPILYVSENLAEVRAATELGLASYLFEHKGRREYLAISDVESYIHENYTNDYHESCLN